MKYPEQTVRFAMVIKKSGIPEIVSLWGKPDDKFLAAVEHDRVMTIKIHPAGHKTQYGLVGFHKEKNILYLLFPKSLSPYKEKRVIGINLDLVENQGGTGKTESPGKKKTKIPTAPPPQPKFNVTVRFAAVADVVYEVSARKKSDAEKKALTLAKDEKKVDFSNAALKSSVLDVSRQKCK